MTLPQIAVVINFNVQKIDKFQTFHLSAKESKVLVLLPQKIHLWGSPIPICISNEFLEDDDVHRIRSNTFSTSADRQRIGIIICIFCFCMEERRFLLKDSELLFNIWLPNHHQKKTEYFCSQLLSSSFLLDNPFRGQYRVEFHALPLLWSVI